MKATVQYEDFVGTAAADISDHTDLTKLLNSNGVDTAKYVPVGASFYSSYDDNFYTSIICRDLEKSTEDKPHLIQVSFDLSRDEFFNLFKRFSVVISENYYKKFEIDEELNLEDIAVGTTTDD